MREELVHITIRLTSHLSGDIIRLAVEQLSTDERARHDRIMVEADRRECAVAHALLRQCLSAVGDRAPHEWKFKLGHHGKPMLEQKPGRAPLSFNLTHTRGLVACVVTRNADVGIDAETLDRCTDPLDPECFLSSMEIPTLTRGGSPHVRFLEIWTLKEAYLKASGEGLTLPLDKFAFLLDESTGMSFEPARLLASHAWCFALLSVSDRYRVAVAVRSEPGALHRLIIHSDPPMAAAVQIRMWNNNGEIERESN